METLEQPIFPGFEAASRSCPPACLASQLPWPGSAEALGMTVGSGRQLSMLLNQSSPLGLFSKILLESSLWTSSEEFCYVWQHLDTRFECSAFQLTPLEPSTDGNESSLWQTPVADDAMNRVNGKINSRGEPKLSAQAKLWPTPTAQEAKHGNPSPGETVRKNGTIISAIGKLWPTPTERDWKSSSHAKTATNSRPLSEVASLLPSPRANKWGWSDSHGEQPLPSGSLNPRFVEELMGLPIDHTACAPLATPAVPQQAYPFFAAIAEVGNR